jgi:peptide-methionine (S)-S-oxide reductase
MHTATFGAGCFWGVEQAFRKVNGVVDTAVGYMGGSTTFPTYEEVCSKKTGHAEVCQIQYDERKVSYQKLLEIFWHIHDPTQHNRQGPDVGSQYRSVIFYHSNEQKRLAEKKKLEQQKAYKDEVVTEILPAGEFYRAEEYHQQYNERQGKVCK